MANLQRSPTAISGFAGEDVSLTRIAAPLPSELAWEVESLLLRTFEYGDYSFRSALTGKYAQTLDCTFALARHRGVLVGAAGCLLSPANPTTAIFGPVAVAEEYRRNGIGRGLIRSVVDHLKAQGCLAVYLGVSRANPAVSLYEAMGFQYYRGIVMRLLATPEPQFEEECFGVEPEGVVRPAVWGDFPGVQALAVWPGVMHTFDLEHGLFSSRYCEPVRFLSIFPDMMRNLAVAGGRASVLIAAKRRSVVGIAQLHCRRAPVQSHVATLDFFVHDNHLAKARGLIEATLAPSTDLTVRRIHCGCLSCDEVKRDVLRQLGARYIATLPDQVCLAGKHVDVHLYRIDAGF